MRISVLLALLSGLILTGCGPRRIEPAEAAVQSALAALYRNDVDGLLGSVTAATRQHIVSQLKGAKPGDSLTVQLDWRFERPVYGRPRLVSAGSNPDSRSVEFMFGNVLSVVPVIREAGAWKVHLLGVKPAVGESIDGDKP